MAGLLAAGLAAMSLGLEVSPALATELCGVTVNCATVAVLAEGNGSGTVTSGYTKSTSGTLARLDCTMTGTSESGTCLLQFTWNMLSTSLDVTFTETPAPGSMTCALDLIHCGGEPNPRTDTIGVQNGTQAQVGIAFDLATRTLTISGSGSGSGTLDVIQGAVTNVCHFPSPGCPAGSFGYPYGSLVTLKAIPDAGASFVAWTGACSGQAATCKLTLDWPYPTVSKSTNVVFGLATVTPKPKATAPPGASAGPTPLATSSAASTAPGTSGAGSSAPGSSGSPGSPTSAGSDSGMSTGVAILIAGLVVLVGVLGTGLIVALRRKPG